MISLDMTLITGNAYIFFLYLHFYQVLPGELIHLLKDLTFVRIPALSSIKENWLNIVSIAK